MTGGCSLKNVADSAGGAFAKNKLFIGNPSNNGGIEEGEIVDHGRLHLAQRLRTQASCAIYRRRVDCSHAALPNPKPSPMIMVQTHSSGGK
jgi:hypothetical protein